MLNLLRMYFNLKKCLSGKCTYILTVPFMYKSPYFKMHFEHRELVTFKAGSEIT
jgi:hypothetical protein